MGCSGTGHRPQAWAAVDGGGAGRRQRWEEDQEGSSRGAARSRWGGEGRKKTLVSVLPSLEKRFPGRSRRSYGRLGRTLAVAAPGRSPHLVLPSGRRRRRPGD